MTVTGDIVANPFQAKTVWMVTGETLRAVRDNTFGLDLEVVVYVNGAECTDIDHRIEPGEKVVMVVVPSGGGDDKEIGRMIAFVAIAMTAPYLAGAVGFKEATLGYAMASAGFAVGGALLVNAFLPPQTPSGRMPDYQTDLTQSTGWRPATLQREGLPIHRLYGKCKLEGNVIATWREEESDPDDNPVLPITNITQADPAVVTCDTHGLVSSDIVYIERVAGMTEINRKLYHITWATNDTFSLQSADENTNIDSTGYGAYTEGGVVRKIAQERQCLFALIALSGGPIDSIAAVKINDKEVVYMREVGVEFHEGLLADDALVLFDKLKLEKPVGAKVEEKGIVARAEALSDRMDELEVKLAFPYGIHNSAGGNHDVELTVEYKDLSTAEWTKIFDTKNTSIQDNRENALSAMVPITGLTRGRRYEVRVTKINTDKDDLTWGDEVYLDSLREVLDESFRFPRLAVCGVKALATNQLSGTLRFSCVAKGALVFVYQDNSVTVTGISKASSAVVTLGAGHGIVVNDYVTFADVTGMTEINDKVGRVTAADATTITVNIDSSGFSTYASGGTVCEFAFEYSSNPAWVWWDILTQPVVSGGDGGKLDADTLQEDDLIVWYKMDDNAASATVTEEITGGANYDGEMQTGGVPDNTDLHDRTGYIDNALDLDGTDDTIEIPAAATDMDISGDLTIAVHIMPQRLNNIILDNRWNYAVNERGYHLQTDDAGRPVFAAGDNASSNDTACIITAERSITVNEWNWVVVTKKGRIVTFYINGVYAGAGVLPFETIGYNGADTDRTIGTSTDADCYSGSYGFGSNEYAYMYIDNLKVWNVALTWDQIRALNGRNAYDWVRFDGMVPSRIDIDKCQDWAEFCDDLIDGAHEQICIYNITKASQAHVITTVAHGLVVDDIVVFQDIVGMTEITDGTSATVVDVVDEFEFVIDLDTSGYTAFVVASYLLCHFDGADAAVTSVDSSCYEHELTFVADAQLDTAQKKFGTASLLMDGTDDKVTIPDCEHWDIGADNSDNWTIDLFVRHVGDDYYLSQVEDIDNQWWLWHAAAGLYFAWETNNVREIEIITAQTCDDGAWHHIAICKVANEWGLYLDGTQIGYDTTNATDTFSGSLSIADELAGHLDHVRINHSNIFGAAPNNVPDDTITPPAAAQNDTSRVEKAEKRAEFNGSFDREESRWDAALRVCDIGRATMVLNGDKVTLVINKADTAAQLFTVGNIKRDSFKETFIPEIDRAAELEVHYRDRDQDYNRVVMNFFNADIDRPTNRTSIQLIGLTTANQVKRAAELRLKMNQLLRRIVEFAVDIDSIRCTIGDPIYVQHDVPQWGQGGRILRATTTLLWLDCELDFADSITYEVMTRKTDDTIETKTVEAPCFAITGIDMGDNFALIAGDQTAKIAAKDRIKIIDSTGNDGKYTVTSTSFVGGSTRVYLRETFPDATADGSLYRLSKINVTVAYAAAPAQSDIFAVGVQNILVKEFRVTEMERAGDQGAVIRAIEYDANIYTEAIY